MASIPAKAGGREKDFPLDAALVRQLLTELLTAKAEDVETEELEIKSWCKNQQELAEKTAEACACLANTSGGYVLVGVLDGTAQGRKFFKCPYPIVNPQWLQQTVHDLTRPPVDCIPYDVSDILAEVRKTMDADLYAIRVPRTRCVSGHTHKSISKVRVGKQCQPQYVAEDDRTSVVLNQMSTEDLSLGAIEWGMAQHQWAFKTASSSGHPHEFLAQARVLEAQQEDCGQPGSPLYAALLLFGKVAAIERHAPFFETVVMDGQHHFSIRKNLTEAVRELCGDGSILRNRLPWIPAEVLKELIVNAYVHRCYRTPSPIVIEIAEWGVEIRSPGELLTGLSISNLIHGVPVYRNLLLADGARFIGLCDKIGQGIDLIFKGVLGSGLTFPEFESGKNLFIARIQREGSAPFKEFLRKRSQSLSRLDEIIILRLLWSKEAVPFDEICIRMQRKRDFAQRTLTEMSKKGMAEEDGRSYRLAASVRRDIETIFQSDQLALDLWGGE